MCRWSGCSLVSWSDFVLRFLRSRLLAGFCLASFAEAASALMARRPPVCFFCQQCYHPAGDEAWRQGGRRTNQYSNSQHWFLFPEITNINVFIYNINLFIFKCLHAHSGWPLGFYKCATIPIFTNISFQVINLSNIFIYLPDLFFSFVWAHVGFLRTQHKYKAFI